MHKSVWFAGGRFLVAYQIMIALALYLMATAVLDSSPTLMLSKGTRMLLSSGDFRCSRICPKDEWLLYTGVGSQTPHLLGRCVQMWHNALVSVSDPSKESMLGACELAAESFVATYSSQLQQKAAEARAQTA